MSHTTHPHPVPKPPARRSGLLAAFPALLAAESTRHGGVSLPPFSSLNLGLYTDDDPDHVSENRKRFFSRLGIDPSRAAGSLQTHQDQILEVFAPGQFEGYDALVTRQKDVFLTVTVADCTPVLVFDGKQQAVAAIHAGWRGTAQSIVSKVLHFMQERFGTQGADCFAYVGTCIGPDSYEVGQEVADHFDPAFKQWHEGRNKFFLDLKKANAAQLTAFGIPNAQIEISAFDTYVHHEDYFSHRRGNGHTGRGLAVIGMI